MNIEQRLMNLERRVSTYRRMTLALAALLLLVVGIAATDQGDGVSAEVRTRRLVIVDDAGREAATLRSYGDATALHIGGHDDGIRLEHGPGTSAMQLIAPAHQPIQGGEGFQTNGLMIHVDRYKSGLFMINPGQSETFKSHGRIWLDTERGFEMSRSMIKPDRVFRTIEPAD
jgi:hypothetical protein